MYIYKMLCLNRLRECKRMISNLLFPSLFFVFFTAYILFLFTAFAVPAIGDIEGFRPQIYDGLISALAVYSFCCCFFRVKPLIIVKPASISLFCEKRLKKLIGIKFIGIACRQFLLALFLALCINGVNWNRDFAYTLFSVLYLLNSVGLLRWKIYHKNRKTLFDFGILLLLYLSVFFVWIHPFLSGIAFLLWCFMLYRYLLTLHLNMEKYEDEMQFIEKIHTAQNNHNTVLLNQYAKEKKLRNLPVRKNAPKLLARFPLVWKAGTSIYRLSREFILTGLLFFTFSLTICRVELFWTIPILDQESTRQLLLTGSIFAVFQLTLRSMLLQLDSILEKAQDGLLIPLSEKQIAVQFAVIPMIVIAGEGMLLSLILHTDIFRILAVCIILAAATVLIFWFDIMHKELLSKGYFLLSTIFFISSLMISL